MSLTSVWSRLPVTCLHQVPGGPLLVGQGQSLVIPPSQARLEVFRGSNVHLVKEDPADQEGRTVVVVGAKSLAVVRVGDQSLSLVAGEVLAPDWLLDCLVGQEEIVLLTAHNRLVRMCRKSQVLTLLPNQSPGGPCILYSGLLTPVSGSALPLVMAGTVLGQVLVWHPDSEDEVLHNLDGHDGVIFSVVYNASRGLICTTSDDRSARLWLVKFQGSTVMSSVVDWAGAEVNCLHVLYGHLARVFRCLVPDSRDQVHTAGEDGRLVSWSLDTGQLVRAVTSNGGSAVWSLVGDGEEGLVTGGGDGSVCLTRPGREERQVVESKVIRPRLVKWVDSDRLLVGGEEGELVCCDVKSGETSTLLKDTRLSSYCLLDVADKDASDPLVLLAGLKGLVILARLVTGQSNKLDILVSCQIGQAKIFAAAVFPDGSFLINGPEGQLTLLREDRGREVSLGSAFLPASKQPWFTVARQLGSSKLVVGDRCGGLHLLTYSSSSLTLTVTQSLPRLHGRTGLTDLLVVGNHLWSTGRDGMVRRFVLGEEGQVVQVQSVAVGHDWVARMVYLPAGMACLVWHGSRLLVQDVVGGRGLGPGLECGGGHRAWDLVERDRRAEVAYIKDGEVVRGVIWSANDLPVVPGGHVGKINVVRRFMCHGRSYLVTGGEDTTIRVGEVGQWGCREVVVMRGHLSSVKCLTVVSSREGEVLVVSGGGRAELRVWRLVLLEDTGELVGSCLQSAMLGGGVKGRKKPWKQLATEALEGEQEAETRLVGVVASWEQENQLLVWVGCSDGQLRTFRYRKEGMQHLLELEREVEHHQHCVLQVTLVPGSDMVLSTTTGGKLAVWGPGLVLLAEVQLHQSGVNCVEVVSEPGSSAWHLVTGGDDNSLVLSRLVRSEPGGRVECQEIWKTRTDLGHSAQVTGVASLQVSSPSLLVSVSVDQRVVLWRVGEEEIEWVASKCCSVADVSGVVCWQQGEEVLFAVTGVGMEVLSFQPS